MGEQVHLIKTRIANDKKKITNFALFIDRFDPERDFPALERRIQDLDKQFIEFDEPHTVLETLVDDPSYADSRTKYEVVPNTNTKILCCIWPSSDPAAFRIAARTYRSVVFAKHLTQRSGEQCSSLEKKASAAKFTVRQWLL